MKIHQILIANRGEIASRIIRTCHNMGIDTVALYTEPDHHLPYVKEARKSVFLPGMSHAETYLNGSKIIDIALETGADAIHPGYGFLSENADFARAVEERGLTFIGPSPDSIEVMGHKIRAKEIASRAGVPLIPGGPSAITTKTEALQIARQIGYPVLLKAAAGGGGKGMRRANNDTELKELFEVVRSEAKSAFGNDDLFIEKYLVDPKHIEIQIFGDQHGNFVHLFERDCSIQRRHQKVIEEAPCAIIKPRTREKMTEAAISLAREVKYYSSGTVEFLMDQDQNFYFLEMNTRLQVEHPVTEMITGTNLVEWQIKVAEGQSLPLRQSQISVSGHAIQLRLYAENYLEDFSPSPGIIQKIRLPRHPGVRQEMGFEEGNEVTLYYDPMIGKIIFHAENREQCMDEFKHWLKSTLVSGIDTTIPFGQVVLDAPLFRSGHYPITFYSELDKNELGAAEELNGQIAAHFVRQLWEEKKEDNFLL